MTGFDLDGFLDAERAAIDAALDDIVRLPSAPPSVADPIRYAVHGGGKRIRPILCVAAYRALAGGVPPPVYGLASSLEVIHAYSLVHDDLPAMDDDSIRRGRAATHVAFGVPAATVAGSALIPLAVAAAGRACEELGLDPERRARILGELCRTAGAGGMVGGQVLDLEAEGHVPGLDEVEAIHGRKTGALLGAAPVMGGVAAGGSASECHALRAYGAALGLAFQIADDILDVTASTAVLGKTAGRDGALAKATYTGVAGVSAARARAAHEVETALAALAAAGIESLELVELARFTVERER